ncbi:hypothetical protein AMTR_s00136p00080790 [Amborella trichopoda]|uniref:Uncharacterized protein n=1 Tax=Amborella trichopoda TaxID=13333 RepID=W1NFM2_AMBTC|nr:hypothetical protein AMTR_s00136p00080790 [Amborella trichopoda]
MVTSAENFLMASLGNYIHGEPLPMEGKPPDPLLQFCSAIEDGVHVNNGDDNGSNYANSGVVMNPKSAHDFLVVARYVIHEEVGSGNEVAKWLTAVGGSSDRVSVADGVVIDHVVDRAFNGDDTLVNNNINFINGAIIGGSRDVKAINGVPIKGKEAFTFVGSNMVLGSTSSAQVTDSNMVHGSTSGA